MYPRGYEGRGTQQSAGLRCETGACASARVCILAKGSGLDALPRSQAHGEPPYAVRLA